MTTIKWPSSKLITFLWKGRKLTFFIAVLMASSQLRAQSSSLQMDTVRWNSTGFVDLLANVTADGPCQFVTYGVQRVDWVQANGNFVISFNPTAISGSWRDLGTNGSLTIRLAFDSLTGQVVFSRTDDGINAELTINGGSVPIKNSYTIVSVEKL